MGILGNSSIVVLFFFFWGGGTPLSRDKNPGWLFCTGGYPICRNVWIRISHEIRARNPGISMVHVVCSEFLPVSTLCLHPLLFEEKKMDLIQATN